MLCPPNSEHDSTNPLGDEHDPICVVGAAVVSLAVKQWSTGVLLLLITVVNALVGLRQEGKAESAIHELWHLGFSHDHVGLVTREGAVKEANTPTGKLEDNAAEGAVAAVAVQRRSATD